MPEYQGPLCIAKKQKKRREYTSNRNIISHDKFGRETKEVRRGNIEMIIVKLFEERNRRVDICSKRASPMNEMHKKQH